MNQDEFYLRFNDLINEYEHLTIEDDYKIGYIIRNEVRRRKYAALIQSGPCMLCQKNIDYKFISIAHGTQGDKFLERLKAKMATFIFKLEADYSHKHYKKIVNYAIKNIEPYFCDDCFKVMQIVIETEWPIKPKREKSVNEKESFDKDRYLKHLIDIFKGYLIDEYDDVVKKRIGFIKNKFHLIPNVFTTTDYKLLESMRYEDFLKTTYWHIVRDYVLEAYNNKCILCNNVHRLNVHHKSYRNHGMEHLAIGDLIVLCKECHAKFHDKLDTI